jgi:hypothetical protein
MKTAIAVTVLSLCPSILFSQSKQAETTTVAKTKETDTTVFGIHLGEKLSIPECKRAKYPVGNSPYDLVNTSAVRCFWRDDAGTVKPNAPVVTAGVTILFPTKDQPEIIVPIDHIGGQVVDDNLEYVTIPTCGLDCQDAALAMLKEKYGEPSSLTEENKENRFGAVFTSHFAEWSQFTNLTVVFHGTRGRTDEGIIYIMTDKGQDFLLKHQQKPQGPKL